nr:class I SAM-dependent methyltransferase [Methylobrevis albus]
MEAAGRPRGAAKPAAAAPPKRPPPRPRGPRTASETIGTLLETTGWDDYALLDMGEGEKLERYGGLTIVRPEPQAMGARRLSPETWAAAGAAFTGDVDEEGPGRWRQAPGTGETWTMRYGPAEFVCRLTAFRHVGVFPEQQVHWDWAAARIRDAGRPLKLLNLFGYTGLASLTAAAAGAEVTHVDASKKAIGWARENQATSGLDALPIRWICDDAVKFCEREVRRGAGYDAIVLDPPKFGRGPDGEVWNLFDDLPHMLDLCRKILSPRPAFVILTAYSIRASFLASHELMGDVFGDLGGRLESGELVLRESGAGAGLGTGKGRALSTSMFSRWSAT